MKFNTSILATAVWLENKHMYYLKFIGHHLYFNSKLSQMKEVSQGVIFSIYHTVRSF